MRFIGFFTAFITVIGLGHVYVGRRLVSSSRLPKRQKRIGWALVGGSLLLTVSPIFTRIFMRERPAEDVFGWIGYIALGFFSIAAVLTIGRDTVVLAIRLGRAIGGVSRKMIGTNPGQLTPSNSDRRKLLIAGTNLAVIGAAAMMTSYGVFEARRRPRVKHVEVPLPNLSAAFDGFKIVQISDIHVGPTIKRDWVEMVVDEAAQTNADLVAFTGDLIDGTVPYLGKDTEPIKELNAPFGRYFVTGNHEYYSGVLPWLKEIDRLGWDILMNEHRVLEKAGARLVLAGVTDYTAGGFYPDQASDPHKAIAAAPTDATRILLAHQPKSVFEATKAGYDLQLSGHTHGGQFFPWDNLARLAQPYLHGLHWHDNMWVYVSRGTGYWGPPIRIGQPSEVTLVTLRRASRTA